eukprot:11202688-Lingulodinium_polyedra.AAC.1
MRACAGMSGHDYACSGSSARAQAGMRKHVCSLVCVRVRAGAPAHRHRHKRSYGHKRRRKHRHRYSHTGT